MKVKYKYYLFMTLPHAMVACGVIIGDINEKIF